MNPTHFSNATDKERITNMWAAGVQLGSTYGWAPTRTFHKCITEARKIDRCWGKRMAQERRQRLDSLQERLAAAQLHLETHPDDVEFQAEVLTAREFLHDFHATQAAWVDTVIQARWIAAGDKSSKLFYKQFKGLAAAKDIPELLTDEGVSEKTWEGMARMATEFFSNILGQRTDEPSPRTNRQAYGAGKS